MRNNIIGFLLITTTTCSGKISLDGFMFGSSPSKPNPVLKTCQQQAVARQLQLNHSGSHGRYLYNWCSTYDDVIPCIERQLPNVTEPTDWFLRMTFNSTKAVEVSRTMCANFAETPDLSCADSDLLRVSKCMQWTSKSAIDHFMEQFQQTSTMTDENRRIASIYACIITFTTAGCFQKESRSCPDVQRRLLNDYYTMLGGKCRTIAGLSQTPLETTVNSASTDVTKTTTSFTAAAENSSTSSETTKSRLTSVTQLPEKTTSGTATSKTVTSAAPSATKALDQGRQQNSKVDNSSAVARMSVFNGCFLACLTILWIVIRS